MTQKRCSRSFMHGFPCLRCNVFCPHGVCQFVIIVKTFYCMIQNSTNISWKDKNAGLTRVCDIILFLPGSACDQYGWKPCRRGCAGVEPEWNLQPVCVRHFGGLLHSGSGECGQQHGPRGKRHGWPLWGEKTLMLYPQEDKLCVWSRNVAQMQKPPL